MAEPVISQVEMDQHTTQAVELLRVLFCSVFGVRSVPAEATPDTVDSWNSLNHMRFITAIEEEFQIQFSMEEIEDIQSFDSVLSLVLCRR